MNDKKIIDKKEVYNNFLDRAVNMAKQGKRQNILTPGFYDAVRIGKDFFDLSQEEVYDEIERRLGGEMQELIVPEASEEDVERQKEMNKELDTTLDTQKQINDLQKEDLIDLDKFLNIDDTNLYNFYNGFDTEFEIEKNNISLLFKNFKY